MITEDLVKLGVKTGDLLAVHSSLKSIGFVEGGAETVVAALKNVLGLSGTLMMPVFNSPVEVFNAREQPSKVGIITETFRKSEGAMRSLHPTHSVAAWGKKAHHIIREHHKREALGVASPFNRLAKHGGKVLMIGVNFTRCSIIHVAESLAGAPYQMIFYPGYKCTTRMVTANGRRFQYTPRENPGDSANFGIVEEYMRSKGMLIEGKIGNAHSILASAQGIIDASLELLKEDGAALLCKKYNCLVCPQRRKIVNQLCWVYSA